MLIRDLNSTTLRRHDQNDHPSGSIPPKAGFISKMIPIGNDVRSSQENGKCDDDVVVVVIVVVVVVMLLLLCLFLLPS